MRKIIKENGVILIESIIFAIFLIFGIEINQKGAVQFQDIMLYVKIILTTMVFAILIFYLYKLLTKMETKEKTLKVSEQINIKKYIIVALVFLICWVPLFLAVYPGYFCYDATSEYYYIANNAINSHHPILHAILLGGIVHGVYLLTGAYNYGIAAFTIFQMFIASSVFSYTVYFMEKYGVSKVIRIIAIIYYAIFPVIQMFVLNSSKDTLFTLVMMLWIMCLIDIWNNPEKFIQKKKNIAKYMILVILFCALRNNAPYVFIVFLITFLWIDKKVRLKMIMISLFSFCICQILLTSLFFILNVEKETAKEMLSVPVQQLGYTYTYDNLTEEEKKTIEDMFEKDALKHYNPQLADPLKDHIDLSKLFKNWTFYLRLGIHHPQAYINSFLMNTTGFWYPNQVIDGYNQSHTDIYGDSKTCYFLAITESPGERKHLIPWLENAFFKLSRDGIVENIPIVNLFFSIGANFWLVCLTIGYSIYRKRISIAIPLCLIILLWGTVLLGPIVLVRYLLIVFFMFPLTIRCIV